MMIDVDHFKQVNDSHGHDVGDRVLKIVADILNQSLGRFLIARAGGEEFFVLLSIRYERRSSKGSWTVGVWIRMCSFRLVGHHCIGYSDWDSAGTYRYG